MIGVLVGSLGGPCISMLKWIQLEVGENHCQDEQVFPWDIYNNNICGFKALSDNLAQEDHLLFSLFPLIWNLFSGLTD